MGRLLELGGSRRVIATAAAAIACAVAAPFAHAGTTPWAGAKTDTGVACESSGATSRQTFKAFADLSYYVPAPNGNLESGSLGWTLTGGASVVTGNEPFYVGSKKDSRSLAIPAGATATTPALCLGVESPYSRLFVKGAAGASLVVDLLYVDANGVQRAAPIAILSGSKSWVLSPRLYTATILFSTMAALKTVTPGDFGSFATTAEAALTPLAYRFTASGGTWQVDDLYVDPFKLR